jgi:NADPH:quinone reductase-like Zn-dependent oxidoreductase
VGAALGALRVAGDRPAPTLDDDCGVRIRVRAAGTNFFDLLQMVNKYQVRGAGAGGWWLCGMGLCGAGL